MQREKNMLFMILALVFALLATGAVYLYMKDYEKRIMNESGVTVPIVGTNIDLIGGTEIREYMLTSLPWPKKKLLDQHFTSQRDVIGKIVKTRIPKGMPILKGLLHRAGDNLSQLVPDKMRAMTLRFDSKTADTSFVQPGSFVDILATFKNKGAVPFTKTILQNVHVIAVNGKVQGEYVANDNKEVNEITVLVKPIDTEKLALAKSLAKLQVVLRNMNDNEELIKSGVDEQTIMYGKAEETKSGSKEASPFPIIKHLPMRERTKIKVIRGTEMSEVTLQ